MASLCRIVQKTKREIMLVIDGSGSMSGDPTKHARQAAELFIRDLPHNEGQPCLACVTISQLHWQ